MKNKNFIIISLAIGVFSLIELHTYAMEKSAKEDIPVPAIQSVGTNLYLLTFLTREGTTLYIPKEVLMGQGSKVDIFKKICLENNITFGCRPASEDDVVWSPIYDQFMEQAIEWENKEKPFWLPSLHQVPKILMDAKLVLKSFLLKDTTELPYIREHYIKKPCTFHRLFSYAALQQVIENKNLTHIRLPRKILVIKNKKTKEYLTYKEASEIIDNAVGICLGGDKIKITEQFADQYLPLLFAHKEQHYEGKGMSKAAMKELEMLCDKVPFDIGYGNIFWDRRGNAVIIDTEIKETSKSDCVKLSRYSVNSEL